MIISGCDLYSKKERTIRKLDKDIITFDGESIEDKIRAFRKGKSQYIIVGTPWEGKKGIDKVTLDWDNRNGCRACFDSHWIAMKITWKGKPGKSPVIMYIADSGDKSKDNRYTVIAHSYYYLFVHSKCC